jgi:glycosyltransferase involved in cell wall biosynthesis
MQNLLIAGTCFRYFLIKYKPMRIILLGNYAPDGQESMERFAQMLNTGFQKSGIATEIWRPVSIVGGRVGTAHAGIGKWLGYVDKWVLFPLILRWRVRRQGLNRPDVYFHVCDHSNSPYLGHLNPEQSGITCHDVLAIRGSLGYADAFVSASRFGRELQKWIFYHLSRAKRMASVSELTLQQLLDLVKTSGFQQPTGWKVIHNAFNADFRPLSIAEREATLQKAGIVVPTPFLLHVGSSLARKNRGMLLEMVHALGSRWSGNICFAGEALDESLLARINELGLRERVISAVKPDHAALVALYSNCEAFVFPSFSEGFGWPLIEAQACGAPVIASNIAPMPEVSGGSALHADPNNPTEFAEALLILQQPNARANLVQRGFENCRRFEPAHMIQAYLNLYEVAPAG